jgi:hypothetical protein
LPHEPRLSVPDVTRQSEDWNVPTSGNFFYGVPYLHARLASGLAITCTRRRVVRFADIDHLSARAVTQHLERPDRA